MGVELAIMLGKGWILLGIQPFVMGVGSLKWVEYGLLGGDVGGVFKARGNGQNRAFAGRDAWMARCCLRLFHCFQAA